MITGISFLALLTGALAQRFLQGRSGGEAPEPTPSEAEMMRRIGEMSYEIAELRRALGERHE